MVPIRDVSLFVKVIGQGEPLLLMHGGPGLDHSTLSSLEPLADQFTLIFYDHRCNGRSTGEVESMTFENLAADADALRQRLGFERWAVLGHSFGGLVALEYALRYPARLSHLLLLDTCADAHWVQHIAPAILAKRGYSANTVKAAYRFFGGDVKPNEMLRLVRKFIGAYYYDLTVFKAPHAFLSGFRVKMRPDAFVFGFKELYTGWTVMDRLHEIVVPALVLAGRYDFLSPSEHDAIVADRLPNATLEIIERAGHLAHEEQPAEVLRAVRRFLTASDRRESATLPFFEAPGPLAPTGRHTQVV